MLTVASEQGIKAEDTEDSANQDSEMADVSGMQSEDEEGEGGEGEDDEEGEEEGGDDEGGETPNAENVNGDAQAQEAEDSEMSEVIQPSSIEEADQIRPPAPEVEEVTVPKVRFQPLSLGNLAPPHSATHPKVEGSPLKNVMIQSPTEPSPLVSPQAASASFSASSYLEVQSRTASNDPGSTTSVRQMETIQGVLDTTGQPSEPIAAAVVEEVTPIKSEQETPQPLAADSSKQESTPPQAQEPPSTEDPNPPPQPPAAPPTTEPSQPAPAQTEEEPQPAPGISLQPPDSPALLPTVAEDEDDGLNLLGSLERELDRQEGRSSASSGEEDKVAPPSMTTVTEAAAAEELSTTSGDVQSVSEETTAGAVEGGNAAAAGDGS